MESLEFTFKKSRKLGDLLSDYIQLYKKIFKHFNRNILIISLPFIGIFLLLTFYFMAQVFPALNSTEVLNIGFFISLFIPILFFSFFFYLIIATFGIEYMRLLEKNKATDFNAKEIFTNIRMNFKKYLSFFFFSILVFLGLLIPLSIIAVLLMIIPFLGSLAIGVLGSMISVFFSIALLLYIEDRASLTQSYSLAMKMLKKKIFEYGLALYIFQLMIQIILGLLTLIPLVVLFLIAYNTLSFNDTFFFTFEGKLLISIGSVILAFFFILTSIYIVSFLALSYYSLIEDKFTETAIESIDNIGNTQDEF